GSTSALTDVVWTGSQFLAVGQDGAVTTSPDGATWTPRPAPTSDSFTAVGASPSLAVATTFPYSGSQSALLTTPAGITWTPPPPLRPPPPRGPPLQRRAVRRGPLRGRRLLHGCHLPGRRRLGHERHRARHPGGDRPHRGRLRGHRHRPERRRGLLHLDRRPRLDAPAGRPRLHPPRPPPVGRVPPR